MAGRGRLMAICSLQYPVSADDERAIQCEIWKLFSEPSRELMRLR